MGTDSEPEELLGLVEAADLLLPLEPERTPPTLPPDPVTAETVVPGASTGPDEDDGGTEARWVLD
ncbi:hypothetical protein [Streptomyces sp. NPDC058486]|uniref:hypothetical protein n=1 Tax=unclassified Streptomyces TaxID=2593676 RepID=UPI003647884C